MNIMLCSICQHENHHLAVVCTSCGSYLQTRIDNLDLFATAGKLIERPYKAFHDIAISRHKNYTVLLAVLSGFPIVFFLFWLIKAGEFSDSLLNILFAGATLAPPVGLLSVAMLAGLFLGMGKIYGIQVKLWNALAVVSYAFLPIIISSFLVLPLEIMTFGQYFFTLHPSPYLLRPTSYVLMLSLDGFFIVWTCLLLFIGLRQLTNAGWIKVVVLELMGLGIWGGIVIGSVRLYMRSVQ